MRWQEVEDKDRFIAANVMGWQPQPCPEQGKSWDDAHLDYSETKQHWYCARCGIVAQDEGSDDAWLVVQHKHTNPYARYAHLLDLALQVAEKAQEKLSLARLTITLHPNVRQLGVELRYDRSGGQGHVDMFSIIDSCDLDKLAESICYVVAQALGLVERED